VVDPECSGGETTEASLVDTGAADGALP
jgi:hypothetical protein